MRDLLDDPFALLPASTFRPAGRRVVELLGSEAELFWLPERRNRRGRPLENRPAFAPDFGARIVAEEALWSGDGLAITPNRHPFAARQILLWRTEYLREPDLLLLSAGLQLAASSGGTLLVNTISAAASIVRTHAHLVGDRLSFLGSLELEPTECSAFALPGGIALARAAAPFPCLLLAVRGPREARAETTLLLARHRTTPAYNLVDDGTTTWFCPRPIEVPAPHFPQALGSAELWGRWCWDDEEAFRGATAADLAYALAIAGLPRDVSC